MEPIEFELNGAKMKYENNNFYRFLDGRWQLKTTPNCNGYNKISIQTDNIKKQYYVHRIIYWLHNRDWKIENPKLIIDHDDRNKQNNDISNLRDLTHQENMFNTDAKGYYWYKSREQYRATIQLNKKQIHLGYFDTEAEARQAYLNAKPHYHIINS